MRLLQGTLASKTGPDPSAVLTEREQQILERLARGLTSKQIGRELALSERTIGDAITALLDKLQVRSRLHPALHRQS